MASVFMWFALLQLVEIGVAIVVALRVHLSIQATDDPEYERGRTFLKAVGGVVIAGGLLAFFWLVTFFGDDVIPGMRDMPGYLWGLLSFLALARLPYFWSLGVLWRLMDSVDGASE